MTTATPRRAEKVMRGPNTVVIAGSRRGIDLDLVVRAESLPAPGQTVHGSDSETHRGKEGPS